MSAMQ